MEILKRGFVFLLFLLALVSLLRVFLVGTFPDFTVYYYGSKAFLSGANPYIKQADYFSNYVYPPFVLLFFVPFTYLSIVIASYVWTSVSLASFVGSVVLLLRMHKIRLFTNKALLFVIFAMLAFPVKFTLGMGQINLFILFIFLLGVTYYLDGKKKLSGVFFGLTLALKFFPVILLAYFLFRKEWKVFVFSCITFVLLCVLALLFVGFDMYKFYILQVIPGIFSSSQIAYYNQALSGVIARQFTDILQGSILKIALSGLLVIFTFYAIWLVKKKSEFIRILEISLIMTLSLLVHSFSWQHHFVWLLLPFSVVLSKSVLITKKMYAILLSSAFFVGVNAKRPEFLPLIFQSHVFFGTILLWLFLIFLLYKKSYAK
jgi:hypothetical protein